MATGRLLSVLAVAVVCIIQPVRSGCARMTAAVETEKTIIFAFGKVYREFNTTTKEEVRSGYISLRYLLPQTRVSATAIYHPKDDPTSTIIVSGRNYYKVKSDGSSQGPNSLSEIFPKSKSFSSGIDAATTFKGQEYFFKGCTMVVKRRNGKINVYRLPKLRLPCFVDSAWTRRGIMVIAKGEKSFRFTSVGQPVRKACFANYFKTSLNMCKC